MIKSKKQVLHLCGSPTNEFFYNLSLIYAKDILLPPNWEQSFLIIDPKKNYYLTKNLGQNRKKINIKDLKSIIPLNTLVIPHLFCKSGMTEYRDYFENELGFSIFGSSGKTMSLTMNKYLTKDIVNKQGLKVAQGELIYGSNKSKLKFPIILKPNDQDNSTGLRLVYNEKQFERNISELNKFYNPILAEEFIPGREIRIAVIKKSNYFYVPAIIEYLVSDKNPIRKTEDKLDLNRAGDPYQQSTNTPLKTMCPADLNDELKEKITTLAIIAHKAIGARDYSLFDFRIDNRTNEIIFLEAGLFWSFSKTSIISKMLFSGGDDVVKLIDQVWTYALPNNQ